MQPSTPSQPKLASAPLSQRQGSPWQGQYRTDTYDSACSNLKHNVNMMSNMNFPSQRYILKSHPCPSPASSNFRTEHQGRIADIRDQCWRGNLNLLGCKNLQGYVGLAWPTALEIPGAAPTAATRVCKWKIAQNHPAPGVPKLTVVAASHAAGSCTLQPNPVTSLVTARSRLGTADPANS